MSRIFIALMVVWLGLQGTVHAAPIVPKQYLNDDIRDKVVQLADSIVDNDDAETGLALLRAYKLTRKMKNDGTFVTDGHAKYLERAGIIAQNIIKNLNNGGSLGSTDLAFLYYLSDSDFFQTQENRGKIFEKGKNALEKARAAGVWGAADMADWVELFRLYGEKLSGETQNDLKMKFLSRATLLVNYLMERRYITTEDGGYGVFYMKGVDGYYGDYINIALHARITEVLKRFYSSCYQEEIKASVAFLNAIQSNGYFYGKDMPIDIYNFDNDFVGNIIVCSEVAPIYDQAFAIMAQAVNCQTTWNNYNIKKGTYWGANALMAMSGDSQNAAEIISALYYSCREGDVDRSGKIIGYDALKVLKASVGRVLLNGPALLAADFDGDDKITSIGDYSDAQCILKLSVGKEPPVPVSP